MSFRETVAGILPADWKVDVIDNLKADKRNAISMGPFGSKIKKECFVVSGIPIIRGTNLKPFYFNEDEFVFVTEEKSLELKSSFVERKDIVITHRGTLGQVGYIPEGSKFQKYIVSQSGMKLTCDENKIISKFLYYYLNSSMGQYFLLMNRSQVGVPAIAQASTALKKIPVPIPSLPEQKAIAHILSTLDEKIEVNNQINKTLEKMAQTIFKQWFVDFEFPNEDGEPYQSSGGEMVESELGLVPKGWKVGTLNDLGVIVGGGTPSKKRDDYFTNDGIPWITPKDLSNNKNRYFSKGALDITELGLKNSSAKLMPSGSVLFSSRAPIGYITIAKNEVTTNQGFKSIIPKEEIGSEFVFQTLKMNTEVIQNRATGSTFKEISGGELKKIQIVVPDVRLIRSFIEIIDPISEMIMEREDEIEKLKNIRDMLLPKLMCGEIRVSPYGGFSNI